jgi:DNA-binding MarR family transcriptional regulator
LKLSENIPVSLLVTIVRKKIYQLTATRLEPFQLTSQQFWVILLLEERQVASVGDISKIVGVDKAAASRIVEKLTERALVTNARSTEDRRRLGLELTDKGKKEAARLNEFADQLVGDIEQGLLPEERTQLQGLLRKMLINLERLNTTDL